MKTSKKVLMAILVGSTLFSISAAGNKENGSRQGLSKVLGTPVRTYLNINNISTVIKNDGFADIDAQELNSGLVYPKGSGKTAVFQSGLLWGAIYAGQVRVGGSTFSSGLQPGKIVSPGVAEDPALAKNRIYRVRPDYRTADLSAEIRDEGGSEAGIRTQYETDWNEWPVGDGAPYDDVDSNGIYDPTVDIPGVPGSNQTVWYVCNDLDPSLTTALYGSNPMGIEMQVTMWAYSQQGALGNMNFRKYLLINKSTTAFDSMFVSQWSDVDLGNATDDFAGCDTSLSLGYVYNSSANDATYAPLPPPAVGFDFFQGPIVPDASSTAIFRGRIINGYRNLPMTAYYYFARGDATVTDPTLGSYEGTLQFYNFLRGRVGRTGQLFVDPNTNQSTTFVLPGDPTTRAGWVDGQILPPGDRRIGLSSGPFVMAPGDTQEVVVAQIVAGALPGTDRLSAIGLLKFYDQQAQVAYDNFFDLPIPPPAPAVNVTELDREIVLEWGEALTRVAATENSNSKGYVFQGYNVYQLPSASASISDARRLATFDVADGFGKIKDLFFDPATGEVLTTVKQFGNDTGIKRYFSITNDDLGGGNRLVNGTRYYFAVTAYNYNPDPAAVPNNLENPLTIFTVVPHSQNPGVRYPAAFGDTVFSQNVGTGPKGDGRVIAQVVDPTKLTGHEYRVDYRIDGTETVWDLLDVTTNVVKLTGQTNQSGDDTSPIVDGMIIRVFGPALDFKRFSMLANGNGPITEMVGFDVTPPPSAPYNAAGYSADWYRDVALGDASILNLANGMQVGGGWYFIVAGGSNIADHASAIGRWSRDGSLFSRAIPNDYEIRFTATGGKAFSLDENIVDVPFELWMIGSQTPNDPSDDIRMIPWLNDEEGDGIFNFKLDHQASGGTNDPYSDWIYFMMPPVTTPGSAGYQQFADSAATGSYHGGLNEVEQLARVVLMNWNQHQSGGAENAFPDVSTIFRIEMTKPSKPGNDAFAFTAPAVTFDPTVAKADVTQINVFPNPYYGVNPQELNKYQRFVTFTHLPNRAIIRIMNLAGVIVRVIEKESNSQFERWDLANDSGLPVGSGLYIAYIEMPDIGATKILKVAIVQEEQILDRF